MKERLFLLVLLQMVLIGGVLSTRLFGEDATNSDPPPVVFGAIYNLTGSQAGLDVPSSMGARLAVKQINAKDGLLGRPVKLALENGESNTQIVAQKTADVLASFPSSSAVLGLSDTDMVLAAAPVAAANKRVFLTSGATSPLLPAEVPKYLFLALGYDTVGLLAKAISDAQSAEPSSVLTGLSGIRKFDGVTGTLSYSPGSRIPRKTVTILEIDQGKTRLVSQMIPEYIPAP